MNSVKNGIEAFKNTDYDIHRAILLKITIELNDGTRVHDEILFPLDMEYGVLIMLFIFCIF